MEANKAAEAALGTKLFWRVVPLLFLLVMLNYIDRSNIGFAALQMNGELGFTPQVYGTGAAIFFVGYLIMQIPANMLVHKYGARRTIAWIMVAWGLIAAAMALISDTTSFYVLRFLLAIAEAGMVPGATLYVSQWFPQHQRARAIGTLYTSTAVAVIIGAPLSGALLELPPLFGLQPWQSMFILEALPTILLAFFVGRFLADKPADAGWLNDDERTLLAATFERERAAAGELAVTSTKALFKNGRIWLLFLAYTCIGAEFLAMVLWLPQIIRQLHDLRPFEIGLLTAVPYLIGVVLMVIVGWHSDRTRRRSPYVLWGLIIGAVGCSVSAYLSGQPVWAYVALTIGIAGINPLIGPFWSFATSFMRAEAAASGIGLLASGAAIGGFVATFLLGVFRNYFGNFEVGLYFMAGVAILGAIAVQIVARPVERRLMADALAPARD